MGVGRHWRCGNSVNESGNKIEVADKNYDQAVIEPSKARKKSVKKGGKKTKKADKEEA